MSKNNTNKLCDMGRALIYLICQCFELKLFGNFFIDNFIYIYIYISIKSWVYFIEGIKLFHRQDFGIHLKPLLDWQLFFVNLDGLWHGLLLALLAEQVVSFRESAKKYSKLVIKNLV